MYGDVMFTAANRRDAFSRRVSQSVARAAVTPSSLMIASGYQPGTTEYTYTHPADADPGGDMTPGQSYPAVRLCFETTDYNLAQTAESEMAGVLAQGSVVGGSFGTFNAGSG